MAAARTAPPAAKTLLEASALVGAVEVGVTPGAPDAPCPDARFPQSDVSSDFVFTGTVGSDGSMPVVRPIRARRTGWAAVATDEDGEFLFACYGPCGDRCPTAHRAEIWGILGVLRHARYPVTLLTDHQSAVKAWQRGKEYCCDSGRAAADIWRMIWAEHESLLAQWDGVGEGFRLLWVKGHTGIRDIGEGIITERASKINNLADKFAGAGADLATLASPNEGIVEQHVASVAFYQCLCRLVADWPADYKQDRAKQPPPSSEGGCKAGRFMPPVHTSHGCSLEAEQHVRCVDRRRRRPPPTGWGS